MATREESTCRIEGTLRRPVTGVCGIGPQRPDSTRYFPAVRVGRSSGESDQLSQTVSGENWDPMSPGSRKRGHQVEEYKQANEMRRDKHPDIRE